MCVWGGGAQKKVLWKYRTVKRYFGKVGDVENLLLLLLEHLFWFVIRGGPLVRYPDVVTMQLWKYVTI